MADKLKSSYELAMERLQKSEPASGKKKSLTAAQKEKIAQPRRAAPRRRRGRRTLFHARGRRSRDPAELEKAEAEYQIDRQRINADLDRAIETIRSGR